MTARIALVEDTVTFAAMLRVNLAREGYDVRIAASGTEGLTLIGQWSPDLVVLDLMLPGMSGFTLLQRLRDGDNLVPVLILSARGSEDERLRGFALGADDYLVKPFGLPELLARIRAVLRRADGRRDARRSIAQVADLTVDYGTRVVRRGQAVLALRPREFDLLAALIRHEGHLVSREALLSEVWGYVGETQTRTVEMHVAALRRHLGDDPREPRYIHTVRGVGYRLAMNRDVDVPGDILAER